jgi:hypothetical protein
MAHRFGRHTEEPKKSTHHGEHEMIGPGGVIQTPKSESKELSRAIALLDDLRTHLTHDNMMQAQSSLTRVETILYRLSQQVGAGYHRNPSRRSPHFLAGTAVGKIGTDVHEVKYTHAENGKPYKHDFAGEVEVYAIQRDGHKDLLFTHVRGLPLWQDF